MIRSRERWHKISIAAWIVANIPFVILGFKAGLLFGLSIAIGILGLSFTNRAFRPR